MSSTLSKKFSKTTEFADLFVLFDKLTSHRRNIISTIKSNGEPSHSENVASQSLPSDLEPVYRTLATLVGPRTWPREDTREITLREPTKTRPRSRTIAAVPSSEGFNSNTNSSPMAVDQDTITVDDSDDGEDAESKLKFPLDQTHPFTFRMMLHKLYELEEWGKKVKDVLERSQSEFKPLAESKETPKRSRAKTVVDLMLASKSVDVKDSPRVHFGVPMKDRSPARPQSRPRSHTMATAGGRGKDVGVRPAMLSAIQKAEGKEDMRAIKKRCIGRRKSTTEMNSSWFYIGSPAAVASSEVDRRNINNKTSVVSRPPAAKYGALQEGPGVPRRIINCRRISSADTTTSSTGLDAIVDATTRGRVASITAQ